MNRLFGLAIALFVLAGSSVYAQGFTAIVTYIADYGGAPLTTTCQGAVPIPDGRVVKIFWDANSTGPDASDVLAPLCAVPPSCETGPAGTVSMNEFQMNGQANGLGAGYFYLFDTFSSALALPTPPRYYLRVYEPDNTTILWTSTVKTMASGPNEWNLIGPDWTCGAAGPQCTVIDEHE